ncbi:hypothetical protein H4W80_008521 [Nonomuraea angiospora]|uniref:Glycosyl hydrolase family 95 N-terminal domain-containing protein n=1 Tax=Nonomuraea angiospora TaxID=46172 RepID=A0ABR9MCK2_9ACTN|nr:glycoside hydrolase N-terminal domain-containing protein [Nonomuraea angiospora]MBE1590263.1 hypothetical protein [Nonomuraea angiospora]
MTDLTLWYDRPATDWETQALPLGNGALGAMVFGGTGTERLQFNEKSLWTGGPGSREGYDFGDWTAPRPDALAGVQERLDRDGRMTPEEVAAALGQPRPGRRCPSRSSGTCSRTWRRPRTSWGTPSSAGGYATRWPS